jgi:pyrroline-5-carboxylate reductase
MVIFGAFKTNDMKVGFLGVGKIAGAIIEGLCTSPTSDGSSGVPASEPGVDLEIFLSPRNAEKSTALAEKYPAVTRLDSNQAVLDASDIVIIALRPAVAVDILRGLHFDRRHTVVSLIPLLKYADLLPAVAPAVAVSRAIPLPAVIYHQCPIPLYHASETVTQLFGRIGQLLPVTDEDQLHALWTLTGLITPFYEQLNALSKWTTDHGVDRQTTDTYMADLFQSLSYMAQQSRPIDFAELAQHAATPNGMNEQAGREIRDSGAHAAWVSAADHLLERFT